MRDGGEQPRPVGFLIVRVEELVRMRRVDIEYRVVEVRRAGSHKVLEEWNMSNPAGELVVDAVRSIATRLTELLSLCEEAFVDSYYNQRGERLPFKMSGLGRRVRSTKHHTHGKFDQEYVRRV